MGPKKFYSPLFELFFFMRFSFFSPIQIAPSAQNSLELKIHIRNVAQDTSVLEDTNSTLSTALWEGYKIKYISSQNLFVVK